MESSREFGIDRSLDRSIQMDWIGVGRKGERRRLIKERRLITTRLPSLRATALIFNSAMYIDCFALDIR